MRLILCLAQIVFQIHITLKNVIEIQNTKYILKESKIQNTNYISCILKYVFQLLVFQLLHNTAVKAGVMRRSDGGESLSFFCNRLDAVPQCDGQLDSGQRTEQLKQ